MISPSRKLVFFRRKYPKRIWCNGWSKISIQHLMRWGEDEVQCIYLLQICYTHTYLDLPNDVKILLFQKLLLFWGTCIFFCLRAFFGFGPFWGAWTSHNGADKNLKRRNFPSKKRNFPSKKRKNKSGWQAFPSSQNPKHETALFLEKSKKYTKQQKKVLFQLRAIISHNRKFQVYIYGYMCSVL